MSTKKQKKLAKRDNLKLTRLKGTRVLVRDGILVAPPYFCNAPLLMLSMVCTGCGSAGAIKVIPNTIFGMPFVYGCFIHDFMYEHGVTAEDKVTADKTFYRNLLAIIKYKNKWYTPTLFLKGCAWTYYTCVVNFGKKAYWRGKTK